MKIIELLLFPVFDEAAQISDIVLYDLAVSHVHQTL